MRILKLRSFPIQRQLFITFSLLILLIAVTISVAVAVSLTASIEEKLEADSLQTASFISMELDSEFENMEAAKRQILYSTQILNSYFDYLTKEDIRDKSEAFSEVSNTLYHVLGTTVPQVKMIGLYGDDSSKITTEIGENTSQKTQSIIETSKILDEIEIGAYVTDAVMTQDGLAIRALTCFNFTQNRNKKALLEIQQEYDIFLQAVKELERESEIRIYVLNANGKRVYPYTADHDAEQYEELVFAKSKGILYVDGRASGRGDMVAYETSDYSGWTALVVEPEEAYMKPVGNVIWTVVAITLVLLVITLFVTFLVAKSVTKPLKLLQGEIENIALETLGEQTDGRDAGNYSEYEQLRSTFNDMRSKLNDSIHEYMEARREQMQTKILTLQSKMHPHFINNVLASIQIMTEEQKYEDVIKMCSQLSQMLRYTMDEFEGFVTLRDEIEYAENYVNLMKTRHKNRLVCSFDIEEEYMDIKMPKMVVQPLIENSIKHGLGKNVLHIKVSFYTDDKTYRIIVKDNGLGFSKKKLKLIESYKQSGENKFDKNSQADRGVGLKNIISRFSLIYEQNAVFEIVSEEHSTIVTVGGLLKVDRQYE